VRPSKVDTWLAGKARGLHRAEPGDQDFADAVTEVSYTLYADSSQRHGFVKNGLGVSVLHFPHCKVRDMWDFRPHKMEPSRQYSPGTRESRSLHWLPLRRRPLHMTPRWRCTRVACICSLAPSSRVRAPASRAPARPCLR